ncbi:MAG: DNA topoisomerase III, partial [Negativicutes bacterium]|nr:DNA topoisomerase III [Negativicutes bacterium]
MGKILVLAEKPSVGKDIARVLGAAKGGNGYLEGAQHVVTWALGHLVTLADPEAYDPKYKEWRLEDLPLLPPRLELVVIKESGRQFQVVKSLLQRQDISEVVIATDAGREGELVARWILAAAAAPKPVKRLWISSVTDKAIKEGFSKLRPGKEYENLYAAAAARAEADWYVGINATRALTCKYNAQLSCGRVQTPTLAIIAHREEEIKNFQPRTYYGIAAATDKLRLTWQDGKSKDTKTFDKERCEQIINGLKDKPACIEEITKTLKKNFAPQLYDLTELQRDANKLFGFSAKETLAIMQRLYETHKLLTYPRTDSRYLSADIVPTLPERLRACGAGQYAKPVIKILRAGIKPGKHVVDDSKVTDHHAIIPTEQFVNYGVLSDKERKIYDIVIKRFLAVFYPPFEYEQVSIKARIGSETFIARGKTVLAQGWKEIYENKFDDEEDEQTDAAEQQLPPLVEGEVLPVKALSLTQGATKPPAPFTEATLLSALENPVKYMTKESDALKKTIGETGGLGTVATRADIIEKLLNSFLIERKGKDILLTAKGRQLLELVPEELKSPALTARWEQKLAAIAQDKLDKKSFIDEMKNYAKSAVMLIKNSQAVFRHDNLTRTRCPECGKYLLAVNGKKGKMLLCQDRACGYRKGIAQVTNA